MEFENSEGAIKMSGASFLSKVLTKAFVWLCIGLIISTMSAFVGVKLLVSGVISESWFYVGVLIELAIVVYLASRIPKMSSKTYAIICFFVHSVVNGFIVAPILLVNKLGDVSFSFVCAAAMFAAMALIGTIFKKELSDFVSVGVMLLIGCIITTLLSTYIFKSTIGELVLFYLGLINFAFVIMYDMKKIKALALEAEQSGDESKIKRLGILIALTIYVDVLNIHILFSGKRYSHNNPSKDSTRVSTSRKVIYEIKRTETTETAEPLNKVEK